MEQTEPTASHKSFPRWRIILLISCILSLIFSLAVIHNYFVYQSYTQGSCTITEATVNYVSSKSSHYYERSYEFTVSTTNGQAYTSHSSSGSYSTYEQAETALSDYAIGSVYQCWYNPAIPDRAALTHPSYSFNLALLYTLLAFIGYTAGLALVLFSLVSIVFPALYLLVRGQRSIGKVFDLSGSGRTRKSHISYSTADKGNEVTFGAGSLKIGQSVTILYDPRGVVKSAPRSGTYVAFFSGIWLVLWLLGLVLYMAYWSWFLLV